MNLENIKEIVNSSGLSTESKKSLIFRDIAKDKKAIPSILQILNSERGMKDDLITDMNLELSRAHCFIEGIEEPLQDSTKRFNKTFVISAIESFYVKYKNMVTHCFNRFNQ